MKPKKLLDNGNVILGVGFVLGLLFYGLIFDRDRDRRYTIYNIMRELKKGMPRQEVESVIRRHDAPFLRKHTDRSGISINVILGLGESQSLTIHFSDKRLSEARIRGEDGIHETFREAPPDIQ